MIHPKNWFSRSIAGFSCFYLLFVVLFIYNKISYHKIKIKHMVKAKFGKIIYSSSLYDLIPWFSQYLLNENPSQVRIKLISGIFFNFVKYDRFIQSFPIGTLT